MCLFEIAIFEGSASLKWMPQQSKHKSGICLTKKRKQLSWLTLQICTKSWNVPEWLNLPIFWFLFTKRRTCFVQPHIKKHERHWKILGFNPHFGVQLNCVQPRSAEPQLSHKCVIKKKSFIISCLLLSFGAIVRPRFCGNNWLVRVQEVLIDSSKLEFPSAVETH